MVDVKKQIEFDESVNDVKQDSEIMVQPTNAENI